MLALIGWLTVLALGGCATFVIIVVGLWCCVCCEVNNRSAAWPFTGMVLAVLVLWVGFFTYIPCPFHTTFTP